MLIMDTVGDTIQAQASANNNLTITLYGIETLSGTKTYKKLGQSSIQNTTPETLYTVPASTSTVLSVMVITNVTSSATTLEVWHVPNAGSAGDSNAIFSDISVPANTTWVWNKGELSAAPPGSGGSVTMSGSYDYITLSGQDIVRGQIVLTTDVTGQLPLGNGGVGAQTMSDNYVPYLNGTFLDTTNLFYDEVNARFGINDASPDANLRIGSGGATEKLLKVIMAVAQTGTPFEIVTSADSSVFVITPAGAVTAAGAISGSNLSGTNTGDQTITLTGDVTGSGTGSFAATIGSQKVTYAKIQNISATSRVLGRITAGAGSTEELTGANLKTIIGTETVPDGGTGVTAMTAYAVLCGGTTSTAAVQSIAGVGTSGQVLTSNGAGALPTFQTAAGGGISILEVQVFS